MKTLAVAFDKGVNTVVDRRLAPEGYAAILDDVDLRSGIPRPIRLPEFRSTAPAGTKTMFEFRGTWHYSDTNRTYAAEYVGTEERVYYCEENWYNEGIPQKIVNGTVADLGTIVPEAQPILTAGASNVPQGISVVASGSGAAFQATLYYYYRIAAIINGHVQPPSPYVAYYAATKYEGAKLTWQEVEGCDGYIIYGRTYEGMREIARIGSPITLEYVDLGLVVPSGSYASTYDSQSAISYFYTYKRKVSTMVDEGGPSPVTQVVENAAARIVKRNVLLDGFFDGAVELNNIASAASSVALNVGSITRNGSRTFIGFSTSPDQDVWVKGMKLQIMTSSNEIYEDEQYAFSYPDAIGNPEFTSAVFTADPGFGLDPGTYTWGIVAYRCDNTITTASDTITATTVADGDITLTWPTVPSADGYLIWRKLDTDVLWTQIADVSGDIGNYLDYGTDMGITIATLPSVNYTGNVSTSEKNSKVVVITDRFLDASYPTYSKVMLVATEFTSATIVADGSIIYITGCSNNALNGMHKAKNPDGNTTFYIEEYSLYADLATTILVSTRMYYTFWTLYRTGDTGGEWLKVADIPIEQEEYTDYLSSTDLGGTPSSYYLDEQGNQIVYAMPPKNACSPAVYNSMLFAIAGNTVHWSPSGAPDAFPDAYSKPFPYQPVGLVPYSGSLIVACEDAIYRMDGQSPGLISVHKTKADGCVAPGSISQVGSYIVYLAKRGLMMFTGEDAVCLTENRIPYRMMLQPSIFTGGYTQPSFWWYPTAWSSQYGALLNACGMTIPYEDQSGVINSNNAVIEGINYDVMSFSLLNKYYMFFRSSSTDFQANTCWCVDIAVPERPITTVGIRPLAAFTTALGEAHVLLDNSTPSDRSNIDKLIAAGATFSQTFSPVGAAGTVGRYLFAPVTGEPSPIRVRTHENCCGSPHQRKRFREVLVHGDGTCNVRVYLDGGIVTFPSGNKYAVLTSIDTPGHPRRLLLPVGSWGYSISVEVAGVMDLRLIEINYDPMTSEE